MSLINSAINQIGREIGRDIYKGRRNNTKAYSRFISISNNEKILNEVKEFKLATYDKVSVRQLANLIELSEGIEPNSFDWEEPYTEIDSKIDFAKENLDKDHLEALEKLDTKNSSNHLATKELHLKFIKQLISNYQENVDKYNNRSGAGFFILSLIGLSPSLEKRNFGSIFWHLIFLGVAIASFYYGYLLYSEPTKYNGNLPISTPEQIKTIKNTGIGILSFGGIIYLIILIGGLRNFLKLKKNHRFNCDYLQKLNNYDHAIK